MSFFTHNFRKPILSFKIVDFWLGISKNDTNMYHLFTFKKNHFSKFGGLAQKYSLPCPLIGMGMAGLIFKDKKMILVSYVDWLQICKKPRSPSNPVL